MSISGACTLLFLVLFPSVAFAQAPPPPPKHEATAEAAFVGVTGNASSNTFGAGGEIIARPGAWIFRHKLAFVRNEANSTLTAQSFLYTPRAERTINTRASLFAEYAFFRDRFAGVADRNSVTGGVSLKLVTDKRQTLALDLGAGYLNEKRLAGANVSSGVYSIGSGYKLKMSATADLTDDLSVLGDASNSGDWRVIHGIAITARLTTILSLKVSNVIRFAHEPAPGFKTTDSTTGIALVAKFASK